MNWGGKLVGAILGVATGLGVVGALIGGIIGHAYDESTARGDDDAPNQNAAATGAVLFRTTFAVMGLVAKADGRVSEREIEAARLVFRQLRLGEAETRAAMDCFTRGKSAGYDLQGALAELREACGARRDLLRYFMDIQLRAALLGSDLQGRARPLLGSIAQSLGISAPEFAHMETLLRLQGFGTAPYGYTGRAGGGDWRGGASPGQRQQPSRDAIAEAYEVLDVPASASDAEVKKAYRRLMSQNHPDKLLARGLPESMLEIAKEKTQAIQAAYERIKTHRDLK